MKARHSHQLLCSLLGKQNSDSQFHCKPRRQRRATPRCRRRQQRAETLVRIHGQDSLSGSSIKLCRGSSWSQALKLPGAAVFSACIACWLALVPAVSADLQTVAPSTATSIAKPLKSQSVDKNKIWLLFAAGGAGLLGTAILLEQNEKLFPAIARANKAMRAAQQMKESQPEEEPLLDTSTTEAEDTASQSAFAAGIEQASEKAKASQLEEQMSQPQPAVDQDTSSSRQSSPAPAEHAAEASAGAGRNSKRLQPKG